MVEHLRSDLRAFAILAAMWIRVSWTYRTSFVVLTFSSLVITGVDFVAIVVMFTNVDSLGGFGLGRIAFLYGATALCLGVADLVVGNVERLGRHVRMGTFDAMMIRPVGVLAQVCANEFALRRLGRIAQGTLVFCWSLTVVHVDWTPARVAVAVSMVVSGSLIFGALFVLGATFQFVSNDASEVANAFTYGGNTMTQYPLTIYPTEVVKTLTFLVPVGFVNWYPALFILGIPDPFGLPSALQLAGPVAALVLGVLAAVAWRNGVRHYRSTGRLRCWPGRGALIEVEGLSRPSRCAAAPAASGVRRTWSTPCATCRSPSSGARWSATSGRTAPASRRRSRCSPACSSPRRDASRWPGSTRRATGWS